MSESSGSFCVSTEGGDSSASLPSRNGLWAAMSNKGKKEAGQRDRRRAWRALEAQRQGQLWVRAPKNSKDHTFLFESSELSGLTQHESDTSETRAELSTRTTGCPGPRIPSRGAGLSPGVWIEGGSIQFSVGHIGSVQSEVARTSLAWAICVVYLHPSWGLRPALE